MSVLCIVVLTLIPKHNFCHKLVCLLFDMFFSFKFSEFFELMNDIVSVRYV